MVDRRAAANIGIPTDGLLVVDVDVESDWLQHEPDKQHDLTRVLAITPSGGRHYVFRQPDGKHWRSSQSELTRHVDIRADNGLFIAPPSALPGGKSYQ